MVRKTLVISITTLLFAMLFGTAIAHLEVHIETAPAPHRTPENQTQEQLQNRLDNTSHEPEQLVIKVHQTNVTELHLFIQERNIAFEEEHKGLEISMLNALRNQNNVTIAVHTFLLLKEQFSGLGETISEIAHEFNNSVNKTKSAENRILTRNGIVRFFIGGDDDAANEIENETVQRQVRILVLERAIQQCDCDTQVKVILQDQIQNMEQEQNRLQVLVKSERADKGIFGWIWKR